MKEGRTALIKSNNPHLAGGEKGSSTQKRHYYTGGSAPEACGRRRNLGSGKPGRLGGGAAGGQWAEFCS